MRYENICLQDLGTENTDNNKGVRSYMLQSRIFVGMVLILIFGEVLGLYGYAALQYVLVQSSRRANCL